MPAVGTRIIIEGFDKDYAERLMKNVKTMFGFDNLSRFFAVCPVLYLRKLNKICVIGDKDRFSIDIEQGEESEFSDEVFQADPSLIIAGINYNETLRKSLTEHLKIVLEQNSRKFKFDAVRYSKMIYSSQFHTRVVSFFAPVIKDDTGVNFNRGSLYRTLPLSEHQFSIPISINAPFLVNNNRSGLEDKTDNGKYTDAIFTMHLCGIYDQLKAIEGVKIDKYIPAGNDVLFDKYSKVKRLNLKDLVQKFAILKTVSGNRYVTCNDAVILPLECYDWPNPTILCRSFQGDSKKLVAKEYANLKVYPEENRIKLINGKFVQYLNDYLEQINMPVPSYIGLFNKHIYPYLDTNFQSVQKEYWGNKGTEELKKLEIFTFELANGSVIRESADIDTVWVEKVPDQYKSFGKYRCLNRLITEDNQARNFWIRTIKGNIVNFADAFKEDLLNARNIKTWDQAEELIATILYFDVEKTAKINYLRRCVLSEEFDSDDNIFRTAFNATGSREIIDHVIDNDDLQHIANVSGKYDDGDFTELVTLLKSMGLKKPNDFFTEKVSGVRKLNPGTLKLLERYCETRESAADVIKRIKKASDEITKVDRTQLSIVYDDIKACHPVVFTEVFKEKLVEDKRLEYIATDFCAGDRKSVAQSHGLDLTEAYIWALNYLKKPQAPRKFEITLEEISARRLGKAIKKAKLNHENDLQLIINSCDGIECYLSQDIDTVLGWMDEKAVSKQYHYFTADLSAAFANVKDANKWFVFDDEKVILERTNAQNSMMSFVNERFNKNNKDDAFRGLVRIYSDQNELKNSWRKSKKEYIEKLARFRNSAWGLREILMPNIDKYINQAQATPLEYVLPELLQNINDCKAGPEQIYRTLNVSIDTDDENGTGTMLLQYDEAGFEYGNVYSITGLGQSSKQDESEGEKGLGFKKVFTVFASVEIYSNGFAFRIYGDKDKNTIPQWISDEDKLQKYMSEGKTTMLFTVKPESIKKLHLLRDQWQELVSGKFETSKISPLFLKNIDCIRLTGCDDVYLRTDLQNGYIFKEVRLLPAFEELLRTKDAVQYETVIKMVRESLIQRNKYKGLPEEEVAEYLDLLTVSIAIPKNISKVIGKNGRIFSTLATERKVNANIDINLPLELTTGRDNILSETESPYNMMIMRLMFSGFGGCQPLFTRMIEDIAQENRDVFLLDYLANDPDSFIETIHEISGESPERLQTVFRETRLFEDAVTKQMVSAAGAYSPDFIICRYLRNCDDIKTGFDEWRRTNCGKNEKLGMIVPRSKNACNQLERFAEAVKAKEGYFPIRDDKHDLVIDYMKDEYGTD